MLLQPVEWHMKKVEEEVVVDEKMYLLKENNEILKNKEYKGIKDEYKNVRRATEPTVVSENGAQKSNNLSTSLSQKELSKNVVSNEKLNGKYIKENVIVLILKLSSASLILFETRKQKEIYLTFLFFLYKKNYKE